MARKDHLSIRRVCPTRETERRVDWGIYDHNRLVGVITYTSDYWKLLRVRPGTRIKDPCTIALYTDHFDYITRFPALRQAKEFVRGPFTTEYFFDHEPDT